MRQLDEQTAVGGQIRPEEMPSLAAQGITMIINNRPDGEEPGQPEATEVERAAAAAGLDYRHIPVAQLSPEAVEAMREALGAATGPVLAFCKSGTRSTYLWALARSIDGAPGETLIAGAAAAGYDLSPIRRFLR
jgi:uncharacterized protein (TIGR01244 family)